MGCATQELTAAAASQQQQTEKLPPSQTSSTINQTTVTGGPILAANTTKLKQSHSALVKLLESAPISTPAPSPPAAVAMDQDTASHHHHYRKKMVKLLEHIKNSDSDISKSSSQRVISDNSNMVSQKNVNCGSGSDEDGATAPLPWKKTRLAREWRQKKQQEQTTAPSVVVRPTTDGHGRGRGHGHVRTPHLTKPPPNRRRRPLVQTQLFGELLLGRSWGAQRFGLWQRLSGQQYQRVMQAFRRKSHRWRCMCKTLTKFLLLSHSINAKKKESHFLCRPPPKKIVDWKVKFLAHFYPVYTVKNDFLKKIGAWIHTNVNFFFASRASSDDPFSKRSSIVRAPKTNSAAFWGSTATVVSIVA
jgi:hypothetical protein